jgi:transposase
MKFRGEMHRRRLALGQPDAAERTAILAALERQLRRGDKALVGNTGYRRFLKTVGDGHFVIDRSKADEDARFDRIFVLRTNTDLNPLAAMLRYKQLWTVEQSFRTAKHLLATRPIFHKLDETIRGHVFCSFLALVLKAELEAALPHPARRDPGPPSSPTSMH